VTGGCQGSHEEAWNVVVYKRRPPHNILYIDGHLGVANLFPLIGTTLTQIMELDKRLSIEYIQLDG
jgi:hypothetical protein